MLAPLRGKNAKTAYVISGLLMLSVLTFTAGCGSPPSPPGAGPNMGPPGAPRPGGAASASDRPRLPGKSNTVAANLSAVPGAPVPGVPLDNAPKPADLKPSEVPGAGSDGEPGGTKSAAPSTSIEQAGNLVALAADIITAGTNPFMNKLPKPEGPIPSSAGGDTAASAPEPADPFQNVSLQGVMYSARMPMALVSLAGGEAQSQIVNMADKRFITVDGGQLRVLSIKPTGIEVEEVNSKQRKTLSLPNIIGYSSTASGGSGTEKTENQAKKSSAASSEANPSLAEPQGKPTTGGDESLSNLKKLSKSDPADVKLQEP